MKLIELTQAACGLIALSTIAWAPCVAYAQQDPADKAFDRGTQLVEEGKLPESEVAFEEAWALRQTWDFAGNLGFVEAAQGKWEEAAGHLYYAVKHLGGLATPEQRQNLEARLAEAKAQLGTIQFKSSTPFQVRVGEHTQNSDVPLFLKEGSYRVECTKDGYESTTVDVVASKGDLREVVVSLKKSAVTIQPPGDGKPIWPAALLGSVGGVFVLGGVGLLIGGVVQVGDVDTGTTAGFCSADPECDDLKSSFATANTLSAIGIVSMGVGAAALGGMVIYLALPADQDSERKLSLRVNTQGLVLNGSF